MLFNRKRCEECGKSFIRIEALMQHQQVIHGTDLSYKCNSCGLEYIGMEQMRDHIRKFHTYRKRPH